MLLLKKNLRKLCCFNEFKLSLFILINFLASLSVLDVGSTPVYSTASPNLDRNVGLLHQQQNLDSSIQDSLPNQVSPFDGSRRRHPPISSISKSLLPTDKPRNHLQIDQSIPSEVWSGPVNEKATNKRLLDGWTSQNQPNHASQPTDLSRTKKIYNITEPETINEGSGNGPISTSKYQTQKFDDTEDGGDDEDDYDDSEIGSGHGNMFLTTQRKPDTYGNNNQLNKPSDAEAYNPFRQPMNNILNNNTTKQLPTKLPKVKPDTGISSQAMNSTTDIGLQIVSDGRYLSSQKQPASEILVTSTTTSSTIPIDSSTQKINPTVYSDNAQKHRQTTPSVDKVNGILMNSTQIRVPDSNDNLNISKEPITLSHLSNNRSTVTQPTSSITHDAEDDYEEENDEDDSEEASNFEDNVASDNDNPAKTTTPSLTTIFVTTQRPYQMYTVPDLTEATKTTPKPTNFSYTGKPPSEPFPSKVGNIAQTNSISKFSVPTITTANSIEFTTISPVDDLDYDDDEEEEEDDELIEEELSGDDLDPKRNLNRPEKVSSIHQINQTDLWTTTTQLPSTNAPTTHIHEIEHTTSSSTSSPLIPVSPSTMSIFYPVEYLETTKSSETIETKPHYLMTTPMPTTLNSTERSTATTFTTTTTTVRPTNLPFYTTTMRVGTIKYFPTQRSRITPIVTKSSETPAYDRSLQDDDTGLTRQIYDKAVEVYEATNKAVQEAISVVWSPSMELNSSTFDPLLAQPLLFMFIIGGALTGLVLTLLLVVYIITYQIQSNDDDVSIY